MILTQFLCKSRILEGLSRDFQIKLALVYLLIFLFSRLILYSLPPDFIEFQRIWSWE